EGTREAPLAVERLVVATVPVAAPREEYAPSAEDDGGAGDDDSMAADASSESPEPLPVRPIRPLDLRFAEPEPEPEPDPEPRALDTETRLRLESYARELAAARGPKPLAVVERLFTAAYVPLRDALDRGADLPACRAAADEWAAGFEHSYSEAYDALRVRTKRPTMVVDVPDLALRVARLHGARSTQLLLVDGLRYDLAEAVNERLQLLAGRRAACAERYLLWAALPTTTATQVELIGRGPAGLRDAAGAPPDDLVVARGNKAGTLRRLKAGHRELLKLDIVEARIAEPGGPSAARLEAVADEVADRLALHFDGLAPRTLVMVFGDHGFRVRREGSAPVATQGGASPEEVLVPASAWLVGAVH
ncbi:MAG: hypothetical protein FJ104_01540, partial [Deltaproteobacteria bacterium]|nr:hypothetical protein [Deltaproteobacteria bacterium]